MYMYDTLNPEHEALSAIKSLRMLKAEAFNQGLFFADKTKCKEFHGFILACKPKTYT